MTVDPSFDPTSPKTLALLFTRARKRRGWSLVRLAAEADTPQRTTERACVAGTCHTATALKLAHALEITLFSLPAPLRPPNASQGHHG